MTYRHVTKAASRPQEDQSSAFWKKNAFLKRAGEIDADLFEKQKKHVRALEVSNEILSLAIRAGDRLIIMSKKNRKNSFRLEVLPFYRGWKPPKFRTKRLKVQKNGVKKSRRAVRAGKMEKMFFERKISGTLFQSKHQSTQPGAVNLHHQTP